MNLLVSYKNPELLTAKLISDTVEGEVVNVDKVDVYVLTNVKNIFR